MLSYRPPCGASSAWAWAWAWGWSWAWSWAWSGAWSSRCPPAGAARGTIRGARSAATSAACHRREEPDLVVLLDRRGKALEVPDVLAVDVDVDESVQVTLGRQELAAQARVPFEEGMDDLPHRRPAELEGLDPADGRPEDGWDVDGAHARPSGAAPPSPPKPAPLRTNGASTGKAERAGAPPRPRAAPAPSA